MTVPVMRPELEALPEHMRSLPLDERGYPVPWFVAWIDGKPEFRAMDATKWRWAVQSRLCWVCGHKLGTYLTFVIGPMCGINRTTSEPPCHLECAQWSARNCPFLSRPHMVRREDEVTASAQCAGIRIERNPGVSLLWTTREYSVWNDGQGKPLIEVGEPRNMQWWAQGRLATREEVKQSVESGIPILAEVAAQERGATEELMRRKAWLEARYPAEKVQP